MCLVWLGCWCCCWLDGLVWMLLARLSLLSAMFDRFKQIAWALTGSISSCGKELKVDRAMTASYPMRNIRCGLSSTEGALIIALGREMASFGHSKSLRVVQAPTELPPLFSA